MKQLFILLVTTISISSSFGQEGGVAPFTTFGTTRVLNNHSIETLKKKTLDFRITHRFGDIAGDNGGFHTLYGLDNSADIRIAFEYGYSDNLMIGAGRSKGVAARELFDGFVKYKALTQSSKTPISLALLGSAAISVAVASTDVTSPYSYDGFAQRLIYTSQAIIARKMNDRLSLQVVPSYHHRNFVAANDKNGLITVGAGARYKITNVFALNVEYTYSRLTDRGEIEDAIDFKDELGFGLEFDLGGHVFQVDFVNSRGIGEYQFLSGTTSNWGDGQYRLGFTISRPFKM